MTTKQEVIHSRIWNEEPEADNPFAAKTCYCSGFDVFGDLLGKASWIEYLFLLFLQEPPTSAQAKLLEGLAVALANPGPRDHSVRAAMNAGVCGSSSASALMAALAVGAGQLGGGREVRLSMEGWEQCGEDIEAWNNYLQNPPCNERIDVWPEMEHPPGFDPNGASCPTPVLQVLDYLAQHSPGRALSWLQSNRSNLEQNTGMPLTMTGVSAATLTDLGLSAAQGEMLYLLLRLPGAAVHSLEQGEYGWRRYPFFGDGLEVKNDPGPANKGEE